MNTFSFSNSQIIKSVELAPAAAEATPVVQDYSQLPIMDRLRQENRELRQTVDILSRHRASLQMLIAEAGYSPTAKRTLAERISAQHGISLRHACRLLQLARSTCWYVNAGSAAAGTVPAGKDSA